MTPTALVLQQGWTRYLVTKKIKRKSGWRKNIRVCSSLREKRTSGVSY